MAEDSAHQDRTPLRLELELRPEGDGVAGSLDDDRGSHRQFDSWLGLLTLLLGAARDRT